MAKPRPVLKAVITCDQAIKEAGTNKWTLVGLFNQIMLPVPDGFEAQLEAQLEVVKAQLAQQGKPVPARFDFGITHPQLGAYFGVANAEGEYKFEIHFVKPQDTSELIIAKLAGEMNSSNRLLTTDFAINFRNLNLPGFGRYAIKLLIDEQFVGEKTIDVIKVRPPALPKSP